MPDTEGPDKKASRERQFMRETIVKPPLTKRQIMARAAAFLAAAAAFGAVAAVSFAVVKPWAELQWGGEPEPESASIQFDKDDPDYQPEEPQSPEAQTAESESVPVEELVDAAMETYEFSSVNLDTMYESLRQIHLKADKGIVTINSGKQQTDLFGNPVETTGYYAGAVIARTSSSYVIFTRSGAVEQADSIHVEFYDGTGASGTVIQADQVLGTAVIRVDAETVDPETRKEIQVIPLGNSYSVKAGDPILGVGAPSGIVHSVTYGTITYVARNAAVTDGTSRILFADMDGGMERGTFLLNTSGEIIGWADDSLKGEHEISAVSAMSISDYKGILEKMTNQSPVPYFGIQGQDVTPAMAEGGMPAGVYLSDVVSGGPAYEAGLQNGDIVTAFGETEVFSLKELSSQIETSAIGSAVNVTVMRKGRDGYARIEYVVQIRAR